MSFGAIATEKVGATGDGTMLKKKCSGCEFKFQPFVAFGHCNAFLMYSSIPAGSSLR